MTERWRLIIDPPDGAAWNMAVDEALLRAAERGTSGPVLRLYRWEPAAVSLGYFQEWGRAVNEAACREAGIDIVRRPTGGRAVFHHREVTYSVVLPPGHPMAGQTVMEGYRRISEALQAGLARLGIAAVLARPAASPAGEGREALAGACFDSASRYELEWNGRKVVGSAQLRRASGAVLQHGSIPLEFDVELTARVLAPGGRGARFLALILAERAGSLSQALGRPVEFDEAAPAIAEGFAAAAGVVWDRGFLTEEERRVASQLAASRYATDEWNRIRPAGRTDRGEAGRGGG